MNARRPSLVEAMGSRWVGALCLFISTTSVAIAEALL